MKFKGPPHKEVVPLCLVSLHDCPLKKSALSKSNEVSAAYGISRSTIYNLIAANKLRTIKIGKRRLVPISEAERLLHGVDSTRAEPQQDAEAR
jgi:excisionase family DNA binding protein